MQPVYDTFRWPQMTTHSTDSNAKSLARAILTDIHFWIPAIVLLGGLWVLDWIR
jgi:hypothetical protein